MGRYLLFSGGYDSVAALINECKTNATFENAINVISIEHDNLPKNELKMESTARKKILRILKKKYNIKEIIIKIDSNDSCKKGDYGLIQQTWWILHSLPSIPVDGTLVFGYYSRDQIMRNIDDIQKIVDAVNKIQDKKIQLYYPFQYWEKIDIIKVVKEEGLFDYCWTCDEPIKEGRKLIECGKCHKCVEKKLALYEIEIYDKINKQNKNEIKRI